MKHFWLFFIVLMSISCAKENRQKEPFQMYETSELAVLMEGLYMYNDSIKQQILNGEDLSALPYDLQKLHSTQMTDRFERDANFNKFAEVYTNYQMQLVTVEEDSLIEVYNTTIQTCIACHQTSCTGPIPRIKKLLIE